MSSKMFYEPRYRGSGLPLMPFSQKYKFIFERGN